LLAFIPIAHLTLWALPLSHLGERGYMSYQHSPSPWNGRGGRGVRAVRRFMSRFTVHESTGQDMKKAGRIKKPGRLIPFTGSGDPVPGPGIELQGKREPGSRTGDY